MKFADEGIIISLKKYGEKSLIMKVFTKSHGVYKGFIKYANSSKNNSIFQIGNTISFDYVAKSEDNLGSFLNFDLCENNSAKFIFDKLRINCAKSIISIIDNYFLERESFKILYKNFVEFLSALGNLSIKNSDIVVKYIKLELLILECLGYGVDLSSCVVTNLRFNLAYVSPKSARAVSLEVGEKYANKLLKLPFFLLENSDNESRNSNACLENYHLTEGLELTGYFLNKFLFILGGDSLKQQNILYRDNIFKNISEFV